MEIKMFGDRYRGRRVLVTGHTGFKGSWLALWLQAMGAEVTGLSLPASSSPNHWDSLGLNMASHYVDVRDVSSLGDAVKNCQPEIVFHLAAQSLVRASYDDPLLTWSTNVMGTANLLEACRRFPGVQSIVVVSTDKCYENQEWPWGYRESDRLGGHDPYSASKACTELVAASFRHAFFRNSGSPLLATARAGNVVGGGDWAVDRLIPDLARSACAGRVLQIRSPRATRPWQHVLDCLSGYLTLGQHLLAGDRTVASAWNFGPGPEANQTVATVLGKMAAYWPGISWATAEAAQQPHEATLLYLDSAKARRDLAWRTVWSLEQTLEMTSDWYRTFASNGRPSSRDQLAQYTEAAVESGVAWAGA